MGTKEFADGFKKTLAFRCAPSSRTESRQVAMLNIGLEDTVAYYTVEDFAAGFKKTLAFQTCVFKQDTVAYYTVKEFAAGFKKGSSAEGIWIITRKAGTYFTSPDVLAFMGVSRTLCKLAMLNNGMEDTVVYYTVEEFAAGFKKTLAFQTCVCKQNSGSSGEDTLEVCASRTPPSRTEVAMLNFVSQDMFACYMLEELAVGFKKTQTFPLSSS
ncbi:hypothetical protein AK812_SmicGene27501 [Symbiodinium microadriaticum]|uniref:Uncharacterized protein n=1 Tax=Symbiodinium microadriaticum TaxID=2951 RepID=A0A1Q9D6R4_SYMMI|nr:hypothetical protein AK812_SmicGene27501 [Symbiodinium microadriaticum]